jgi:hypothetical protein
VSDPNTTAAPVAPSGAEPTDLQRAAAHLRERLGAKAGKELVLIDHDALEAVTAAIPEDRHTYATRAQRAGSHRAVPRSADRTCWVQAQCLAEVLKVANVPA